ncbi:MAG: asparagine synthase (glutamine-hydrolyzing) [Alphaproteobacteria bacterium]|nr:asparagine synthase (glutamine-hydrolyzing) [Alphaproteobacteria bacterium]
MCGIAGIMTTGGAAPSAEALSRMETAIAHRGPDGTGTYREGDVAFVHNRLAIIDLVTGDQPLREAGGAALVANGEIYSHVELRAALADWPFRTQSDCEPPLALYRRDGVDFAQALRGMYAMAIHDARARKLVLARDPFGIKPLYYATGPHGIAFASEAQALRAAGFGSGRIDPARRAELLELQFQTGDRTIFDGIKRLLPGDTLVAAGGQVVERRSNAALPAGGPVPTDHAAALLEFDRVFQDSILVHQRSDVPYGMFLSGGVDSSAVLAMMARLNERPVHAFTAHFPETDAADEREAARRVAGACRADLAEVAVRASDFWAELPAIAAAMDDPAADYACVPTYLLARAARQAGLKVVLSGEGGDELFAGYGRYRSAVKPWWMGGRAMRRRGTFEDLGVLREPTRGWRDGIAAAEATAAGGGRTRLQATQAVDIADWLPNDLLTKLDRCLMAHAVEGRTPFLDPLVANFAFRLPDAMKIHKRWGKWLLRGWLDRALPAARAFAPKQGFTVPVQRWIAGAGDRLGPLVAASAGVAEIADRAAVERLFRKADGKRQGFAAWTLLFYALWHRRHVLGRLPDGDVFHALDTARAT